MLCLSWRVSDVDFNNDAFQEWALMFWTWRTYWATKLFGKRFKKEFKVISTSTESSYLQVSVHNNYSEILATNSLQVLSGQTALARSHIEIVPPEPTAYDLITVRLYNQASISCMITLLESELFFRQTYACCAECLQIWLASRADCTMQAIFRKFVANELDSHDWLKFIWATLNQLQFSVVCDAFALRILNNHILQDAYGNPQDYGLRMYDAAYLIIGDTKFKMSYQDGSFSQNFTLRIAKTYTVAIYLEIPQGSPKNLVEDLQLNVQPAALDPLSIKVSL